MAQMVAGSREQNVMIIEVCAEDKQNLYSAEDIAMVLRYNNSGQDRWRILENYRHEYLVWAALLRNTIEF